MRDATTLFSLFRRPMRAWAWPSELALSVAELVHGSDPAHPAIADFRLALGLIAGMALLAVIDSVLLPAGAGQRVLSTTG